MVKDYEFVPCLGVGKFRIGWLIVCALSFYVLLPKAYCQEAEPTGEYRIGTIQVAGNRTISEGEILSRVRSRAGENFDRTTAAEDAKRIAEIAGVQYSYYSIEEVGGEVQLTFVVVESELVRSVEFVGNRAYSARSLRKRVGLKAGDWLDMTEAGLAVEKLTEYYQKRGYAFGKVVLDSAKISEGKLIYRIQEGPRVKISSVKFSGNSQLKTKSLKKAVKVRKSRFFVLPSYYLEDKAQADIGKLQKAYQRKGFLDADVRLRREFKEDKRKVVLTFVINEGRRYMVKEIVIAGNEHFGVEQLAGQLKLKGGDVYSEQGMNSDAKRLLKLYKESGFIDVKVEQHRRFVSADKVGIEFTVDEGERFRIGQINITGNDQTQDKVIRRVLDEYDFKPGRWYNADIASGDGRGYLEKLLRRSALTESAVIMPAGRTQGQRDAEVSVIEGQTGMVMVGAGVASDSGVIGQLVFEQRNFDITDKPESFEEFITGQAFKGAGQNFRISLQPGTEVSEYSVSFTEPYFDNKPVSLDVIGSSYERGRESYDEQRTRGYVGLEKRYKNKWRRSVSFRLEDVDVGSLDTDAPKEVVTDKGSNLLAGLRIGVGKDNTDDRFNPSEGYKFNAGFEQVAGDHTFGVLSGTYNWFKTLHEDLAERKTILATRLHAGAIIGDAPVFEKFYAGGQGSIRGFDYRGVSTRGLQQNVPSPQRKDPIGSDWIFLANAEVAVPIVGEHLSALFFVDSGAIDSGNYRASIGAGIQIMLPQWFGPVPMRFELAVPVMKDSDDETQVFSFSVGRLF